VCRARGYTGHDRRRSYRKHTLASGKGRVIVDQFIFLVNWKSKVEESGQSGTRDGRSSPVCRPLCIKRTVGVVRVLCKMELEDHCKGAANSPYLRDQQQRPPSHPLRQSRRSPPVRFTRDARQTAVEPLRVIQHARASHRTQPEPTAKARRDCHLVLRPCDGVAAVNVAGWAIATRLCVFPMPLGYQHRCHIGCRWCHLPWRRHLPLHPPCWDGLRELPVSKAQIPNPPSPWANGMENNFFSLLGHWFSPYDCV
jgi:hypothetical protein